jgi:hypothetical protein
MKERIGKRMICGIVGFMLAVGILVTVVLKSNSGGPASNLGPDLPADGNPNTTVVQSSQRYHSSVVAEANLIPELLHAHDELPLPTDSGAILSKAFSVTLCRFTNP